MMVEAGGTEKACEYYEAGAPKVTEEVIAGGPRGVARRGSRSRSRLQRELVDEGRRARRRSTYDAVARLRRRRLRARSSAVASDRARQGAARSPTRPSATRPSTRPPSERRRSSCSAEGATFAGREKEIKEAVRSLTKKLVRKRIVEEGLRIDGRGPTRHPPAVGRGRRPARRRTARACSSGARRRCSTSARSACPA